MTLKKITLTFTLLLFNLSNSVAQWTKIAAIPTDDIVALAVSGDTVFAASDTNLIYKSIDGGLNWNTITVTGNGVNISALKIIGTNFYAGTYNNGIFTSRDNGLTWVNSVPNLLAVSSFESKGNDIYVATYGDGVYTSHRDSNNWKPMNDSLPSSYSYNVNTILNTANSLLIGAGANGTFYRFDYNTNSWEEEYYYGGLAPGLQIDKLISAGDTVFAVNGNRIIRSENDGLGWTDDKAGSHNGYGRTIHAGTSLFYTLTNVVPSVTWIQQRSKSAAAGTSWAVNEESVPGGYSYDLLEFKNKFFLAKEDGLYVKDLGAGINNPLVNDNHVKIYTDPYNATVINVLSDKKIEKITLIDVLGRISYSELIGKNEFTIHTDLEEGVYLINVKLGEGRSVVRKLVLE